MEVVTETTNFIASKKSTILIKCSERQPAQIKVKIMNIDFNGIPFEVYNDVAIEFNDSNELVVKFTPTWIGKISVHVTARYDDGKTASKRMEFNVTLPPYKPEKIISLKNGHIEGTVHTHIGNDESPASLDIYAYYNGLSAPISLPDNLLKHEIISQHGDNPPIRLNRGGVNGTITGLHIGHALILTTFDDLTTLTCVDVEQGNDFDPTTCKELVPEGMTPPSLGHKSLTLRPHVKRKDAN